MFDEFFNPKSVAVIGASRDTAAAGHGVLKSLLQGGVFKSDTNLPFEGEVYAVNPNAETILGKNCYASVLKIQDRVDLAVIAVRASIVPMVMRECARKKIKGVIIISAGFREAGKTGEKLEQEILSIAQTGGMRIIGPNCLGVIRPSKGLNATFGPCMPYPGNVAFFSQSGALIDSVIDWSLEQKYGFSTIVSLGNQADLTATDFLSWAKEDTKTSAIALYLEGIKDGKKFMDIATEVGLHKPIIGLKAGRSSAGSKAVSSHTGSLAGSYTIFKTAFKQSGVHLAKDVDALFEMSKTLAFLPPCLENNIAIITNGGGAGVLCTDHCDALGIKLAKLSRTTLRKLERSGKMHPAYSRHNPLDIIGDAKSDRYKTAINTVLEQKDIHGLIVIQTLQTMTQPMLDAKAMLEARKKFPHKPIIADYMGGKFSRKAVLMLEAHHVPDFNIPYKSALAMKALIERGAWLKKHHE